MRDSGVPAEVYHTGRGRVVFVGAVHEAAPALEALLAAPVDLVGLVTLPVSATARASGFVDLKARVAPLGVPVLETTDINAPDQVAWIGALRPDLLVVVGWNRLLKDELLSLPRHGCIGFHASLLPRHRGRAPVNWAIILGEEETGNTMMYLAPGADTGDIVDQRRLAIGLDDTCASMYDKVGRAGAEMLAEHLPALLRGQAPRRKQDHGTANLLPKRTPGMGIIDWRRTPRQAHDWIRGLTHPYPGAFTFYRGRRLHLWASALPAGPEPAWEPQPGTIMGLEGDAVRIRVAGGSILLRRVQQENEAEEPAADWFVRKGLRRDLQFDPADDEILRWARGEGPRPAHVPWIDPAPGGRP